MTHTNDTRRRERPSGARHPGAGRIATSRMRMRVSSDAVVSAYIHDIARPHAGGEQYDPYPAASCTSRATHRSGSALAAV